MSYPYRLSPQIGTKARLGLIVLRSDERIEADFRQLLPEGDIAFMVSRVPSATEVTPQTLGQMADDLPVAAGLLPSTVQFDAVGYGCTSGTSVIGSERIAGMIHAGCETQHASDPLTALVAACQGFGISKIAFLSPYIETVSDGLRSALMTQGIDCCAVGTFDEGEETRAARISPIDLADAAFELGRADAAQAVFLSCTNLNTLGIIDDLEQRLGKPVLSSNQVLFWHMCRLAGLANVSGPGQLFRQS